MARLYFVFIALTATCATAALFLPWSSRQKENADVRAELFRLMPDAEATTGRLTGSPPAAARKGRSGDNISSLRTVRSRIEEEVEHGRSGHALADLAALKLLSGNPAVAVTLLEQAVVKEPADASLYNDLSVALLAQSEQTRQPLDVVPAFEAAEHAVRLSGGGITEPLFNRAVSLEKLALFPSARRAWRAYLKRDSSSSWADRARRHWQTCREAGTLSRESFRRSELDGAVARGDRKAALDLVRRFPKSTQGWIEDRLLGLWAESHGADDKAAAERYRDFSGALAIVVEEVAHDSFLRGP